MPQKTADRVHPETPGFVLAAVDAIRHADRIGAFPLIGKFRRVLQNQDRAGRCDKAAAGRLEMAGENIRLLDAVVREEAVGRLRVGPVLTCQRMLAPIEPPILSTNCRRRRSRRLSARLQPASSSSNHGVAVPSMHRRSSIPCQTRNHTRFNQGKRCG